MSNVLTADLEGLNDVLLRIEEVGKLAQLRASQAVELSLDYIRDTAKELAPYSTGYLRDRIVTNFFGGLEGQVESQAEYSIYREFGTRYSAAQPFMRPAQVEGEQFFLAAIRDYLGFMA